MISNRSSLPGAFVILASLIILLASGCSEKKQIKGREFVPQDEMVELMLDIHLLDGITNDVKYYHKYSPKDSIDLYGLIFEEHGVDRAKFDTTLAAYARDPFLLDELYNEVIKRLNLLQAQIDQEVSNKDELE